MNGKQITQGRIPQWLFVLILLLLVIPATTQAADSAANSLDQGTPQKSKNTQNLPRLAPLGLEKLMEIEVTTVTRTESTVGQSAAAVFVITQEDIRRSGATTIAELLRRVPGMTVTRMDANKWAISSRGFTERFGNKLLVQIDGRTVYNPVFTGVFWDVVEYPLEDIDRIEVVRGPGASVWGSNAVNGVINIITKSSNTTQGGLVTAGGGTEEHGFGTMRYGGEARKNTTYRLYAKGFDRDEQFSGTVSPHDHWWGTSAGMRFDLQATAKDLVTFQGDYVHSVADRRDERPMVTLPFRFLNLEKETTDDWNILGRWTRQLSENSSFSLQAYWERFKRTSSNSIQYLLYDLYDLDLQHQFRIGNRQRITYGFGYRLIDSLRRPSDHDNGFVLNYDDLTRHTQLFSAFIQNEISLVPDKLTLLLGSKFEHNDHSGFEIQPNVRLLWAPTARQSAWVAISRAVRTPSIGEDNAILTLLPRQGTTTFLQFQPSPNLKSEELWAYELGYRMQATDRFSFDLALFYNDYDKLRSTTTAAPFTGPGGTTLIPVLFENRLRGEAYGVELATNWRLTEWWKLYAAYSFLRIQLHRGAGLPESSEAAEGQSPRNQVYLQSSWDIAENWELDLISRFVDSLSGFNPAGTPGANNTITSYFSLDARLGWTPQKNLTIEIVGQNLLDDHHPEFGTSPLILSPEVEIQRGVYGKATWKF